MRVLIIIDQPIIANQLVDQLGEYEFVNIVGQYANPYEGISYAMDTEIDAVFLNIEMSLLNGFTVAEYLKSINPNIAIIFVSQHRHYAVKAFEMNAADYLMLPIQQKRLQNTMKRIYPIINKVEESLSPVVVCCFGSLNFKRKRSSRPINIRWRTRKTEELFAYLILNHGQNIRKDFLVELLWSHIDWQQGVSQLYSAIYQIRQTLNKLQVNITIESSNQYYILHLNGVELDIEKWEHIIDHLPPINDQTIDKHIQTIYTYKGDIFRDLGYIWAKKEKMRLRETWLYHIEQVTKYLFKHGQYVQMINIYHHVQDVYPIGTESYEMLMKLYAYMNNYRAVILQFESLKEMLQSEFDIEPSDDIQHWYKKWCNNRAVYLESIRKPLSNI